MATLKPQPVSEETRQAVANRVRATLAPLFDDITAVEFGHSADIYIVRLENTRPVTDTSWPRAILTKTALTVVTNGTRSVTVKVPSEWLAETSVAAEPDTAEAARRARILQTLRDIGLTPIGITEDTQPGRGDYLVAFKEVTDGMEFDIDTRSPFGVVGNGDNFISICIPRDWPPKDAHAAPHTIIEARLPGESATRILDTLRAVRLEPKSARCIDATGGIWRVEFGGISLSIINIISGDKTPFQVSSSGDTWVNIRVFPEFWTADAPAAAETDELPAFDGDTEQLPGIVIGDPADLPEFFITGAPEAGEPFAEEATDESTRTDEAAVPLSVYGEGQGEGFEDEPTDGLSLEEIFEQAGVVAQEDHEAEIERLRSQLETVQRERDAFEALLNAEFRPTVKQFHIERDTHPAQMEKLDREGWTLAHMQFEGDRLHTVWQREQPQPAAGDPERAAASAPLTDEEIWEIARNVTLEEHKVGEVFLNEHAAHAPTAERIIIDVKPVGTIPQNFTECFPITSLLIQHGPDAVLAAAHDGMMEVGRATFERLMSRPRPQRPPIFLTSGE